MIAKITILSALALAPFATTAQVRCTMPNGVVITQQFALTCPSGAIQDPNFGSAQPSLITPVAPAVAEQPRTTQAANSMNANEGMTVFSWGVVVVLLFVLYKAITGPLIAAGKRYFCMTCGHEGPSKNVTKGSLLIEIILWLAFLLPGLLYSIWRHTSRHKACTQCGATNLAPPDAPMALAAKRRFTE